MGRVHAQKFLLSLASSSCEEMYLCLAGEAVFSRENCSDIRLSSGGIMEHSANQPHSMETLEHPIMAYVVWRNEFGTKPVLTFEDAR